jgi:predicted outer membrane protein
MPYRLKLAIGALGGLAIGVGLVVITASAVGLNRTAVVQSAARSSPTASPASSPSASPRAGNPAARVVNMAVLGAESQVLGITAAELTMDLRQGMTVQQLADKKGINQTDFQAQFQTDVKGILDQGVQQGQLTPQQEQQALKRLSKGVPNWDQVPARQKPPASPSPPAT